VVDTSTQEGVAADHALMRGVVRKVVVSDVKTRALVCWYASPAPICEWTVAKQGDARTELTGPEYWLAAQPQWINTPPPTQ
jgi:hypothetical protein